MIVTVILTMLMVWCLFYKTVSNLVLITACLLTGGTLILFGGHRHDGFLMIDALAQKSYFYKMKAAYKTIWCLAMMLVCLMSRSAVTGLLIAGMMLLLTVFVGKISLHDYIVLLMIPVTFLVISGLALVFEFDTANSGGVWSIPFLNGYLLIKRTAQMRAATVLSRAFGAVSCLYFLSLSTPMTELINVLKKAHIPGIISQLMYLIYRYIFILFEVHHTMKQAATSRMGYGDYRTSLKTTAAIYSNLLMGSYQKAGKMFDAMESRCFDGNMEFLQQEKTMDGKWIFAGILLLAGTVAADLLLL